MISLPFEALGLRDEAPGVTEANLLSECEQLLVWKFILEQLNEQLGQYCLERPVAEPVCIYVFQ